MFEHLVSAVRGTLEHTNSDKSLHLTWHGHRNPEGYLTHADLSQELVGALSTWLKQDHPPTAAQIAARLVERWDRNTDLADAQWGEKLADLERHIAAALEAERAREEA